MDRRSEVRAAVDRGWRLQFAVHRSPFRICHRLLAIAS